MLEVFNPRTRQANDDPFLKLLFAAGLGPDTERLAQEVIRVLSLPDSSTSRGLKKCHESFASVCATLDKVFAQTREESLRGSRVASDHLGSAILLVYAGMGQDNILGRRIVFETLSFLRSVKFLISATRKFYKPLHASRPICSTPPNPIWSMSHSWRARLCVLSHATTSIFLHGTPDPEVVAALPRVLRYMLSVVRLPGSTSASFSHLVMFCQQTASRCPAIFRANPDSLDFLVACSRARDICNRINSQRALIDAFRSPDLENQREREPRLRETRGSLENYYRETEPSSSKFQKAQDKFRAIVQAYQSNPDCPHLDLGKELAALILTCEATVRSWLGRGAGGPGVLREMIQVCEDAVRKAADETNGLDVTADILHLVVLASQEDPKAPAAYAQEALKRHPSVPFFYYIIACCGHGIKDDSVTRVLYAEKGLQLGADSDGMTEYIRLSLLYLTIYSSHVVMSRIAEGAFVDSRMKELNALTKMALDRANTFAGLAQLDHLQRPLMAAVGTLIDLVRNGHLWADDSFQNSRKVFAEICDIARCTPSGFQPMEECSALNRILDRLSTAWETWGSTVSRQSSNPYTTASDVDLIAWFEKLDGDPCFIRMFQLQGIDPGAQRTGQWARLHTCSFCNNGNATLKQCAGCQKTRYCNNVCQRNHWKFHRDACRASKVNKRDGNEDVVVEGLGDADV
ncbi:hypothetical protein FB45DRAFT_1063244 [Roridomyces roridus]|uniref:MYND-type domain-containing protein n=1 Tax=Roridomyces roridus TaxID=1738132 RepID=A0AAD7BEP4_9AGAR|nr:hypothetical protein FB45DRAFT_1063244 [Roridomyces roridus]